jgi:DNA-binding NarL/FixJ family response regulator
MKAWQLGARRERGKIRLTWSKSANTGKRVVCRLSDVLVESSMSVAIPRYTVLANDNARPHTRSTNPSADASWSTNRASIAVLSDLGLSVKQIARHLSLNPAEVAGLLNRPI